MLSPASQTETRTIMMVLTEKMENTATRKKETNTHTHKIQMESLFSNIKEKGHSTKRNTVH
jgi:hypothetical protein